MTANAPINALGNITEKSILAMSKATGDRWTPKDGAKPEGVVWGKCRPCENLVGRLSHDLKRLTPRPVLISNRSDPYPPMEKYNETTLTAIKMLLEWDFIPILLTKGNGIRRDLELLRGSKAWVGVTLTSPKWALNYEHAANFEERVRTLILANHLGLNTWISWEPLDPDMEVSCIAAILSLARPDFVIFGSLNKNLKAVANYSTKVHFIAAVCNDLGIDTYFKPELLKQCESSTANYLGKRNKVPWATKII